MSRRHLRNWLLKRETHAMRCAFHAIQNRRDSHASYWQGKARAYREIIDHMDGRKPGKIL